MSVGLMDTIHRVPSRRGVHIGSPLPNEILFICKMLPYQITGPKKTNIYSNLGRSLYLRASGKRFYSIFVGSSRMTSYSRAPCAQLRKLIDTWGSSIGLVRGRPNNFRGGGKGRSLTCRHGSLLVKARSTARRTAVCAARPAASATRWRTRCSVATDKGAGKRRQESLRAPCTCAPCRRHSPWVREAPSL